MQPADCQGSSSPSFSSFGRSILTVGRDQIRPMEITPVTTTQEVESFQRQVFQRFHDLSSVDSKEILSISWVGKLLDVFLCCHEEFRAICFNNKAQLNRSPLDKLFSEFFERNVKALDVCNAVRDGIEQIRQWQKQMEIILCALDNQRGFGEGQFRRAKRALVDLTIGMIDEKDSNNALGHRNRSFGRHQKDHNRSLSQFRSLSWSVSRSWSASKQLQAIGNNLIAPKGSEIATTNGLSLALFTMNYVLLFVMWALVAAIPCQDRGLQTHFCITRQFIWASPVLSLHERILEESKRKDRKSSCGLLKEIHGIEQCTRKLNELTDSVHFPLIEEGEVEVKEAVEELRIVHGLIKEGLDPLEKQVREVFHRIVRSKTEGLDSK